MLEFVNLFISFPIAYLSLRASLQAFYLLVINLSFLSQNDVQYLLPYSNSMKLIHLNSLLKNSLGQFINYAQLFIPSLEQNKTSDCSQMVCNVSGSLCKSWWKLPFGYSSKGLKSLLLKFNLTYGIYNLKNTLS